MTADWIIRIVLFGIVHWILAGVMLYDLASRQKVFGGRKTVWALLIIFLPNFGSLLYLIFHPQILNPDSENNRRDKMD